MDLRNRINTRELLDEEDIPFADIRKNMEELEVINTWLGGHAITLAGFRKLLGSRTQVHICEIGCGGGDNLKAIAKWCRRKNIAVKLTGIDIKDTCIEYAHINLKGFEADLIVSDYKTASLSSTPDIIFSSLFCHHFSDEEIAGILQWKAQHASVGFFINDLQRHTLAYHSIKLLTKAFSSSYMVQHDAPISVARGFSRDNWRRIIADAALPGQMEIHWRWAFRWLLCYTK
jgi:2-polyprenyl-3-methyl-5-hydroxy-6-metoxy-1,4-benzoquinol methylase